MKLHGLTLLYENIEVILTIVVITIVFFFIWEKKFRQETIAPHDDKTDQAHDKGFDVSRLDIISSKVGVLFVAFMFLIGIMLYRL